MPEVSGKDFFKAATNVEPETRDFVLEDAQNRQLTIELEAIEREDLFDYLHELPEGFVEMMMGGAEAQAEDLEDPEDLDAEDFDVDISAAEMLSHMDGNMIATFKNIFSEAASHPELTSLDMEELAEYLSFTVLFEVFGEVLDISLQDPNEIKSFRGAE